jgi:hypothetical protein
MLTAGKTGTFKKGQKGEGRLRAGPPYNRERRVTPSPRRAAAVAIHLIEAHVLLLLLLDVLPEDRLVSPYRRDEVSPRPDESVRAIVKRKVVVLSAHVGRQPFKRKEDVERIAEGLKKACRPRFCNDQFERSSLKVASAGLTLSVMLLS